MLQMEAIKSLNSLINKTKGVMQATKKSYEAAVQARNATGAQRRPAMITASTTASD
jgi:hypothetical protein